MNTLAEGEAPATITRRRRSQPQWFDTDPDAVGSSQLRAMA
jgi:hypothetical protein